MGLLHATMGAALQLRSKDKVALHVVPFGQVERPCRRLTHHIGGS
jgi:hypothetical protein